MMVGWQLPPLYNAGLHVLEHLMFIVGGLAMYWPMIEATSSDSKWRMSPGAKLVYKLLTSRPREGRGVAFDLFPRCFLQVLHITPSGRRHLEAEIGGIKALVTVGLAPAGENVRCAGRLRRHPPCSCPSAYRERRNRA